MSHLRAIDGLRAVAVLAVVAYHAGLPVPAGFVGVDVFFVISGFLITGILEDERQRTGRISFAGFYARRARRILPALGVVVLATLGLSTLLLPDPSAVWQSAAAAFAFVANVFFQVGTDGYWAKDASTMPLLHLWSLSVEEQFYLVWPLVMLLPWRKHALWTIALLSFALAEWYVLRTPSVAFYQMPTRAWELAVGGLIALHRPSVPRGSALLGLLAVLGACLVPLASFPATGALPAVLGAGLLVAGVRNGERLALLESRPMVYVGLISYSLYLWHWPLLALNHAMQAGEPTPGSRAYLVALAFVLAVLTYRYVESPARRVSAGWRVAALGFGGALALSGAVYGMTPKPVAVEPIQYASIVCHKFVLGQPVQVEQPSCMTTGRKVVVWGDSFAFSWTPLAERIGTESQMPVVTFARDGCPPFTTDTAVALRTPAESTSCAAHAAEALAYIKRNGADTVLLAARWGHQFVDPLAQQGLRNTVAALSPLVRQIVVIGPSPEMRDDVPKCMRLGVDCSIPRAQFLAQSQAARRVMDALRHNPKVAVIDPAADLCDQATCPDRIGGVSQYHDQYHLSRAAVARLIKTPTVRTLTAANR